MFLVPRQLRRSDFPSSVPYYGGRMTPAQIAAMQPRPASPPAPLPPPPPAAPAPAVSPEDAARRLAMLDELRADGVVSDGEYEELRDRIAGGA
jgi:hypothetical protein